MNTATAAVTTSSSTIALESLTVGLPVRVTLTSGHVIEGYVYSAETLTNTGFNAVIAAGTGKSGFILSHYVNSNGLSKSVGCIRGTAKRVTDLGTVASIESLV